ncbi:hypothetical protein DL96DRAFT_1559245 [Flagelloscypha sp. PMI_526]|nr:hypothetical protein DL96DRAFT_1559245 [Flagelloscypha sp. PMI_526]
MQLKLSFIIASATALAGFVSCTPNPESRITHEGSQSMKDLALLGPVWKVQVFPNEEPQIFTGEVDDVYDKVLALNPDFGRGNGNFTEEIETITYLSKRNTIIPPLCWDVLAHGMNCQAVYNLAEKLYNLDAPYGVNGRTCMRMFCFSNTGVALCNDREDYIEPNLRYLSSYLTIIDQYCLNTKYSLEAGQLFDTDNYNILLKTLDCSRPQTWPVGTFPDRRELTD